MNIPENAERVSFKINGRVYTAPVVFSEGHTCTAGEAHSLNQTLRENVRNNMADTEADLFLKETSAEDIQAKIDEYLASYEFGVRGGREADPVKAMAKRIGRSKVEAALRAKGQKVESATVTALVNKNWPKYEESWMEQAKAALEAVKEADDFVLES